MYNNIEKYLLVFFMGRLKSDVLNHMSFIFPLVCTKDTQIQQAVLQQVGEIPHALRLGGEVS